MESVARIYVTWELRHAGSVILYWPFAKIASQAPNKRVQADAAAAAGSRAKIDYVPYFELKPISANSRRG